MNCSMSGFPVYLPELLKLMFIQSVTPSNHLIPSFAAPFSSCPQSFPASGSFPMSWLFASGGQSMHAASVSSLRQRQHLRNTAPGASLLVQWLRLHLPMPGVWVQLLLGELRSHLPYDQNVKQKQCCSKFSKGLKNIKRKKYGSWLQGAHCLKGRKDA